MLLARADTYPLITAAKRLLDDGAITHEEYDTIKRRALGTATPTAS